MKIPRDPVRARADFHVRGWLEKIWSSHAGFAERTDFPYFYQVHSGNDDYEFTDPPARKMPFTKFASNVLKE